MPSGRAIRKALPFSVSPSSLGLPEGFLKRRVGYRVIEAYLGLKLPARKHCGKDEERRDCPQS
jgi:hypothetical protein